MPTDTSSARSRRALLQRELAETRDKLEAAEAEAAALPGQADAAAVAFLRTTPIGKPFALGQPSQKLRARLDELREKVIPRLRDDVRVLEVTAGFAGEEEAVERLEEAQAAVKPFRDAELEAVRKLGRSFEALVDVCDELFDIYEARHALRVKLATGDGLLGLDAATAHQLDEQFRPQVEPAPVTIGAAVEMLVAGCLDPGGAGYRMPQGGPPLDNRRLLPSLLPDLRDRNRRAEFSLGEKRGSANFQSNRMMPLLGA